MREARRDGKMKEREKTNIGRVAMIHNVKWHSLCMSDSLLSWNLYQYEQSYSFPLR